MTKNQPEKKGNKILILCDYYLPGYKSGGGMRTIVNMVDRLRDRFEFFIITRDHDGKLDRQQYTTVKVNQWNLICGAQVYYLSKDNLKISKIREIISKVNPDLIYSNSYFATLTLYLLILKKLRLLPNNNLILAPCGELSQGALQLNSGKKNVFIKLARFFDLYKNIVWKASTELEKKEIEMVKGSGAKVFIAPDMLPRMIFDEFRPDIKPKKSSGEVKMIFLSRFMKKKNFKWLLENLKGIKGKLEIDIYGPLEDAGYWQGCKKIIETLPENIKIESKGSVPHENVMQTLAAYHFFIMPTLGENFGHIFLEALAAGCPLIISDRTPWLELDEKGIGWDLPLDDSDVWIQKINVCIGLDQENYSKLSNNARQFAVSVLNDKKYEEATLRILENSLSSSSVFCS
jgi:glycosyltransferase involved in cell wall biosynthesis